jgi:hypothetical protein
MYAGQYVAMITRHRDFSDIARKNVFASDDAGDLNDLSCSLCNRRF